MAFLPLFVQAVIGTTATQAGGILTPFILTWTVCSVLGSRASLRFGYRRVSIIGMALMLIGTGLLAQSFGSTGRPQLVVDVMFMGMGGRVDRSSRSSSLRSMRWSARGWALRLR